MPVLRTVTLNTGYDDYYTISGLDWGGIGRMHAYRCVPSGKGISCARAAKALGLDTVAYALVGEPDSDGYAAALDSEGLDHRLFSVPGRTRHNLTLLDGEGDRVAAHFVAKGYTIDDEENIAALIETLLAQVRPGDVVSLNGSLPQGLPAATWADLARAVIERGAETIVDAQSDALTAALAVPGVLALKPNETEVLAIPAVAAADEPDRLGVALGLFDKAGVQLPLVSLGADGVELLVAGRRLHGSCLVSRPTQSVMAGDSFVAGLAWGRFGSDDPLSWARHGLATAAAHVAGHSAAALLDHAQRNLGAVVFE